jgi:signal transduction histidine kinase
MEVIGTLTVRDQNGIIELRNKIRLIAKELLFNDVEVVKIASFLSEVSREVSQHTMPFAFSIRFHQKRKKYILFDIECNDRLEDSIKQPFKNFFDHVTIGNAQQYPYRISFYKLLPNQKITIDDALVEQVQANFLRLSEKELLLELERKNQELIKAYEALENSQNRLLDRAQKISKLGGWEIDIDSMDLTWTDEVYHIHELPLSSPAPNVSDGPKYFSPEAWSKISDAIHAAIEDGVPWDLEQPLTTAKGNHKWVRIMGEPIIENNKTVMLSGVFQDVTAQKEIKLELEKKNDELIFKNKELEQFVYVASHDLQEPLRTVINFVGLTQKLYKDKLDEKGVGYMNNITTSSERMRDLIKDLLDYSRIGRKKEIKEVNCNDLVKMILSDLEFLVEETKASIKVGKLPKLAGLEIELKQLFQNLINNGIKFRKKTKSPEISIKATKRKNEWLFSVQDNGIGIPKQHSERIFTIFQRLHNKNEYPGTGIGLALCKKIVTMHGGRIWVESKARQGSTFYFTIAHNINEST